MGHRPMMRTPGIAVDGNPRVEPRTMVRRRVPAAGRDIDDIAGLCDEEGQAFDVVADLAFHDEPELSVVDVEMSDARGGLRVAITRLAADAVNEHAIIAYERTCRGRSKEVVENRRALSLIGIGGIKSTKVPPLALRWLWQSC